MVIMSLELKKTEKQFRKPKSQEQKPATDGIAPTIKHHRSEKTPQMARPSQQTPLRLEYRDAAELQDNPANWRKHPAKQINALRDVLAEVGWAGVVLYNERTKHLIDGHARKNISTGKIPVLIGSWTEEQEKKILATLDPIGALAVADTNKLESLLRQVNSDSEHVRALLLGLASQNGIQGLLPNTIEDQVPEPPDDPITRAGDLYVLGNHRLLCGDSGKAEDVDRLLAGEPIHLTSTDPPFNVKVEPRSNNAIASGLSSFKAKHHQRFDVERHPEKSKPTTKKMRARDRPLENDFVSDEAFGKMLLAWFGNIARVLLPGRLFFIFGGYSNIANYPHALKASGLYFSQQIIWQKMHPVLTRGKCFMGAHEWCFFGWRIGAAHQFFGPPNVSDVWEVKKINPQSMVHLTEKPVELAVRAIEYGSRKGENVLDLFGGSGSTLMAAVQTQRRAFLMEIDPAYCDVIVTRWEQFTGKKAKRLPDPRARRRHRDRGKEDSRGAAGGEVA
jgi:DNA modification methylase